VIVLDVVLVVFHTNGWTHGYS